MLGLRGLVSVTFRKLSPEEIIRLSAECGLQSIEWGADVHVPPLDLENARRVGQLTRDAGLQNVSYGSYYYVGKEQNTCTPEELVAAAEALGAGNVRVWAGDRGSAKADDAFFERVVSESRALADLCAEHGMTLSFEYHGNTLTDGREQAVRLMRAIDHPNCRIYWQPVASLTVQENCRALTDVLPWLTCIHVFQWSLQNAEPVVVRHPLTDGSEEWAQYVDILRADVRTHPMQLEFVSEDSPEALLADSKEFLSWK